MMGELNARSDAQKDLDTLEREIDQTREQLGRTLEALERKLSPRRMLDEGFRAVRKYTGEWAEEASYIVQRNPGLSVAATAGLIGIAKLLRRPGRDTVEHSNRRAREERRGIGGQFKAGAMAARSGLASSKETAAQGLTKAKTLARSGAQYTRDGLIDLFEERPLVLASAGVALVVIAALLYTRARDR